MMNKITNAEHVRIQEAANTLVILGGDGLVTGFNDAVSKLMEQHNISKRRAESHIHKAARRACALGKMPPGYILLSEAAKRIGYTARTLRRAVERGAIEGRRFPVMGVKLASVIAWANDPEQHKVGRPRSQK